MPSWSVYKRAWPIVNEIPCKIRKDEEYKFRLTLVERRIQRLAHAALERPAREQRAREIPPYTDTLSTYRGELVAPLATQLLQEKFTAAGHTVALTTYSGELIATLATATRSRTHMTRYRQRAWWT